MEFSYTKVRHKKEITELFWLTWGKFILKNPTRAGWFFPPLHHGARTTWIKARVCFLRRWNTNSQRIKWQFLHVPELWIRKIVSAALINGNFKEKHGPSITVPPNYILLLRTAFYVPSRLPKKREQDFKKQLLGEFYLFIEFEHHRTG